MPKYNGVLQRTVSDFSPTATVALFSFVIQSGERHEMLREDVFVAGTLNIFEK